MSIPTTYRLHGRCQRTTDGFHCDGCNGPVGTSDFTTVTSEYGWLHVTCGRMIRLERDGRLWCEGPHCNYPVDPIELWVNDPLAERPFAVRH